MAVDTHNITENWVEMSHGKARYLESGSGEPTIFIHGVGFAQGAHTWRPNLGPIGEKTRAIAIDCLGWGMGDRLDLEYSFAYLVDYIREFQDVLGIEKSNIVGHSMGGWLATLLAYESPQRVNKLVLVGSGGTRTRTIPSMTEFQPPSREELAADLRNRLKLTDERADAVFEECWAATQVPGGLDAYRAVLRHMNNGLTRNKYNTVRRLPYITAPTLVVWGENDEVNALEMGEQTAELIPNAKLVVAKGAGHFLPTERPEDFNKIILDFL